MRKINTYICVYVVIISLLVFSAFYPVFAYVMESNNYRIQSDSLNIGGALQTTDNYIMQDTIGEIASGISTSTNYKLNAGYQQMQEVYLSISTPADVNMGTIGGLTGGIATNDVSWTVKTDNAAGFSMSIKASSAPAMATSDYSFADYTVDNTGTPDYNWGGASGFPASASEFGYTVEPATAGDTVQKFLDNGSTCNISGGSNNTDTCWYHFATADYTIINRSSRTSSSGEAEKVKFQAEIGSSGFQEEGNYQSTITVTVVTN